MEIYANPYRFDKVAVKILPYFTFMTVIFFAYGLYLSLFDSPMDYQQKQTVRIMYLHVPAAWMSMGIFLWMGISSVLVVWRRHHLAAISAKVMAPIGAIFCLICLITGSLWGRPTWGTYWIWDARLTSMLILLFIYIGYMVLHLTISGRIRVTKIAAIFCLISLIDLPIIKFSVEWWNTLHQGPSVIRAGGPSIHASMLWPLFTMSLAYLCLALSLIIIGIRTELMQIKINKKLQA